jgi:glycosyltransferase involved in cell wall biosynthesis
MTRTKIAYFIGHLATGGAESQLVELLRYLDRVRFEPFLILLEDVGAERAVNLVDEVYCVRSNKYESNLAAELTRIVRMLREIKPTILHAMLPEQCILGFAAARLCFVPILIGSRLSLVDCYRPNHSRLVAAADRFATRISTRMIANSRAIVDELVVLDKAPPSKISLIYNGIDSERFNPAIKSAVKAELGWNSENIVFGCVANFFEYKRQTDLVVAAEQIVSNFPQARFLLLGEDRGTMGEVRREISSRGLDGFFVIVPGRPDPEYIYSVMDVYVCTSATEGFSNAILEAMACGKPVIATNVGGNSEAVIDGQTGVIVPPYSPGDIASAASALLRSPALRYAMGNLGRLRIEAQFSVKSMVAAHEEVYAHLATEQFSGLGGCDAGCRRL